MQGSLPVPAELMDRSWAGPHEVAADNGADTTGNTGGGPVQLSSEELLEKHGASSERDYCCTFWGTKWDACGAGLDYEDGGTEAFYTFETAWSPPLEWAAATSARYPELTFAMWYRCRDVFIALKGPAPVRTRGVVRLGWAAMVVVAAAAAVVVGVAVVVVLWYVCVCVCVCVCMPMCVGTRALP